MNFIKYIKLYNLIEIYNEQLYNENRNILYGIK